MSSKKSDKELRQLWRDFGDTPIDDDDCIEEGFLDFETGTDRFEVWHWFDDEYSHGVARLDSDIAVEDIFVDGTGEANSSWEQADSNGDVYTVNRDDVIEHLLNTDEYKKLHDQVTSDEFISRDVDALVDYLKNASKDMLDNDLSARQSM